ncbi:hypothetical protein M3182_03845 [Mesobacillus maritimus]|uniref:hypothetical protein n=1 Tax=Mesobacillus maritimus TaxID=1643336 RepID=UPI0020413A34|nr:hypothetical protein [Mesobacillus maritimus]MCM3584877.1 hypothetical protein [Mesobacillus maritimus]MCM3672050.1 hypothetical protein [Mesobacillus maritimus]
MKMDNEKVLYKGKRYTVIYKYSSGYWEIREEGNFNRIELVHQSEVKGIETERVRCENSQL